MPQPNRFTAMWTAKSVIEPDSSCWYARRACSGEPRLLSALIANTAPNKLRIVWRFGNDNSVDFTNSHRASSLRWISR